MMYIVFVMSVLYVVGFIGFSSKPSPDYGGMSLIVSGGLGCGIIMSSGGSFLGLVVFLVYLGGMMVVFGYTIAMATEEYPETWGSNVVVLSAFLVGLLMEIFMIVWLFTGEHELVGFYFGGLEDLVVLGEGSFGYVREDYSGGASLYSYGFWFLAMAGWMLFVSIFIAIEVTRKRY
uniref:NADH-ubiquinone oxidoreductase chain 6 n=1 Tax=Mammuthus primigenius TaxID=37349 RepID=B0BLD1_MAMPR|nr:NADH dehydrogenase subunit 6 [Mammuthus primigenius]